MIQPLEVSRYPWTGVGEGLNSNPTNTTLMLDLLTVCLLNHGSAPVVQTQRNPRPLKGQTTCERITKPYCLEAIPVALRHMSSVD